MHVCHLCDTSVEGDYFCNIAAGLIKKGLRVSLVELGKGTVPSWLADVPEASYFSLNASNRLQYPIAVYKLARFLRRENVAILHTHLFNSGIVGVLSKQLQNQTIVALMRHHTSVVRMLGSRVHIAADKWMAEKADHVMTVSEAAKRYMIDTDGIRRDDIEVVHLGFDFEKLSPSADLRSQVRNEFDIGENETVIGYVGNQVPGKGHLELVKAFGQTTANIPNTRLLLVGKGMIPEVREAAEKIGNGKVIFAGWRSDVAACLNAMDIFVQPSMSEAFSQVLIEAMGVGLPVIATDVGGAREVIESGQDGILIEPGDIAAITTEIENLISDRGRRDAIGRAGSASVRQRFTAEKMVERHFELYSRWMAEK